MFMDYRTNHCLSPSLFLLCRVSFMSNNVSIKLGILWNFHIFPTLSMGNNWDTVLFGPRFVSSDTADLKHCVLNFNARLLLECRFCSVISDEDWDPAVFWCVRVVLKLQACGTHCTGSLLHRVGSSWPGWPGYGPLPCDFATIGCVLSCIQLFELSCSSLGSFVHGMF